MKKSDTRRSNSVLNRDRKSGTPYTVTFERQRPINDALDLGFPEHGWMDSRDVMNLVRNIDAGRGFNERG